MKERVAELPWWVYRVHTPPDGEKDYVVCLSPEIVSRGGCPQEAILGVLLQPVEPGMRITPAVFWQNPAFVDFLHEVIARRGPQVPGVIEEAMRQQKGWVYVIDGRTRTPQGHVPPEDILGAFTVSSRKIVPGSYSRCPKHLVLSADGFVRLAAELLDCLLEELASRLKASQ